GRGPIAFVDEANPVRQGAGLRQGRDREAGGGDPEAAGAAHGDSGGRRAAYCRRLIDGEGEGLNGERKVGRIGGERDRPNSAGPDDGSPGEVSCPVAVVDEADPGRQGAGLHKGGDREAGGGDQEAAGASDPEAGSAGAGDRRSLVYRQGEDLDSVDTDPVAGRDYQRVETACPGGWCPGQSRRPVAVVDEADPSGQPAALAQVRDR